MVVVEDFGWGEGWVGEVGGLGGEWSRDRGIWIGDLGESENEG